LLKTFTSFPMLPSSASDSPTHPRRWSNSDSRSISQFVANSSSSVSTPKRNPSIKNDNRCVEECENSGIVMPYERQPGLMPFAVPTHLWYPQAAPPAIPFCIGPLMSAPYSQYVPPIGNQVSLDAQLR
uniref:Uncharacterized protein n=1 Tax=Parascaris univalens TaxID=6257 RepID=A0A915CDU9_PARUN